MNSAALAPLAVVHPTADPQRTAGLLTGLLGFVETERGEDGSVRLDNGAVGLRLIRAEGAPVPPLELEVEAEDLDRALEVLHERAEGVRADRERRTARDRVERRVVLADGLVLRLVRILTEDDLGVLPPLPATLTWDGEGDKLVRRILSAVPLAFRGAARKRVTRRAEAVARHEERSEVNLETAVRGLVDATPRFKHDWLLGVLEEEGLRPRELADGVEPGSSPGAIRRDRSADEPHETTKEDDSRW